VEEGDNKQSPRFGGGEERMTWRDGTHELGRSKLCFRDDNIFTPPLVT
jgi:hypothetical protein